MTEPRRARTALAQPEPEGPPMPVPGDAEGLAEVFWGRYAQPEPEGHQAIAKRAIESCLAQRDEVLAAFIAKYGFQPEDVIQVEQRQPDGTSTWRIERRPGPKPEELTDEELIKQAITVGLAFQPHPDVEEVYLPFAGNEDPLDDLLIAFSRAVIAADRARLGRPTTTR